MTSLEDFFVVFFSGITDSITCMRPSSFGFEKISLNAAISWEDINIRPFFFIGLPLSSGGFTSIASDAGRDLVLGSLIRDTPGSEVLFLSQSSPVSRNSRRLSMISIYELLHFDGKMLCEERRVNRNPRLYGLLVHIIIKYID